MLILAALAIAAAQPSRLDFQLMISPAYNAFAASADIACPARRLRYLHPADLDGVEEGFMVSITRREKRRIKALNKGDKGCTGVGLSCPAQHLLEAISAAGQLGAFTDFACRSAV